MTAEELTSMGYRRVSNKYGMVARIDRPDWLRYMREQHPNWADAPVSMIADYYRRCVSVDVLTVPHEVALGVPTSCHDATGWIPGVTYSG